jgi:hypothetical protein
MATIIPSYKLGMGYRYHAHFVYFDSPPEMMFSISFVVNSTYLFEE